MTGYSQFANVVTGEQRGIIMALDALSEEHDRMEYQIMQLMSMLPTEMVTSWRNGEFD